MLSVLFSFFLYFLALSQVWRSDTLISAFMLIWLSVPSCWSRIANAYQWVKVLSAMREWMPWGPSTISALPVYIAASVSSTSELTSEGGDVTGVTAGKWLDSRIKLFFLLSFPPGFSARETQSWNHDGCFVVMTRLWRLFHCSWIWMKHIWLLWHVGRTLFISQEDS